MAVTHVCAIFCFVRIIIADPCMDYVAIDQPKRSVQYTLQSPETPICDLDIINQEFWYRFTSYVGGAIPNQCPPENRCGTDHPIWINGYYPTGNAVATVDVCLVYGGSCCWTGWMVQASIKRCEENGNEYFVFQLPPPIGCVAAYCAGDVAPCPPGTTYIPAIQTCGPACPVLSAIPELSGPHTKSDQTWVKRKERFYFECHVNFENGYGSTAKALVQFLFDDAELEANDINVMHPIGELVVTATNPVAILEDYHLRGRLGKTISCTSHGFWDDVDSSSCETYASSGFWAGIKPIGLEATDNALILSPGEEALVPFAPTVPVFCEDDDGLCGVDFRVSNGDLSLPFACSRRCTHAHYCSCEADTPTFNKLPVRIDTQYSFASSFVTYIRFEQINHLFDTYHVALDDGTEVMYPIYHLYDMEPVQVHIDDSSRPTASCRSTGDPHITTLDGRYYHAYASGDYMLLESTVPGQILQVQVRHYFCSDVACNCGVIVREGNIVLGIDNCLSHYPRPVRYLAGENDVHGASITYTGYHHPNAHYKITMPSGTIVIVHAHFSRGHINIYAEISQRYLRKVRGLCGNYDGESNNDLYPKGLQQNTDSNLDKPTQFIQSYRLTQSESMFSTPPECMDVELISVSYCICNETADANGDTGDMEEEVTCMADAEAFPVWETAYICADGERKKKQSETVLKSDNFISDEDLFAEIDVAERDVPDEYDWTSTLNGFERNFTEQEANAMCVNALEGSSVFEICQEYVDEAMLVDNCILDMYFSDDPMYAESMRFIMLETCKANLTGSIVLENDTHQARDAAFQVLASFNQQACLDTCANNGTCYGGVCHCLEGFGGSNCFFNLSDPPQFNSIHRPLCDKTEYECKQARLFGQGAADSGTLSCRFTAINLLEPEVAILDNYISAGTFLTALEVVCTPPGLSQFVISTNQSNFVAVQYQISVSNTVGNFGERATLVVFDGVCVECDMTLGTQPKCGIKQNYCAIEGSCLYANSSTEDGCRMCLPDISTSSWSLSSENKPPEFIGSKTSYKWNTDAKRNIDIMVTDEFPDHVGISMTTDLLPLGISWNPELHQIIWENATPGDASVEVLLEDECGQRTNVTVKLVTVRCPCENDGVCSELRHEGSHIDSPNCDCKDGFNGPLCELSKELLTTIVPKLQSGWTDWTNGTCSKTCDLLLCKAARYCTSSDRDTCEGANTKSCLCEQPPCEEIPAETKNGVQFKLIKQHNIIRLLEGMEDVFVILSRQINRYCGEHIEHCCLLGDYDANIKSGLDFNLMDASAMEIASGFPIHDDIHVWLTLIGRFNTLELQRLCQKQTGRSRRSSDEPMRYITSDILLIAATSVSQNLSTALGMEIVGISTEGGTKLEDSALGEIGIIGIAISAVLIATIVIVALIVYTIKRTKHHNKRKISVSVAK